MQPFDAATPDEEPRDATGDGATRDPDGALPPERVSGDLSGDPRSDEPLDSGEAMGPVQQVKPSPSHLPQPNLGFAVLWAALPMFVQILLLSLIGLAAATVFTVIADHPDDATQLWEEFEATFGYWIMPLATSTTLIVAFVVTGMMYGSQIGRCLGWRNCGRYQWLGVVLFALPLIVIASEVGNCVSDLITWLDSDMLRRLGESNTESFEKFSQQSWWIVFIAGCLFPAIGEEVYCRGFLSRGLIARYGVFGGTIFASLLFGAMHLEPVQATSAFVLGIGLQCVFLSTRSLFAPIAMHTINNAAAFAMMKLQPDWPIPGLTTLPDGSAVHTPPLLLISAVLSCLTISALLYRTRTTWRCPDGSDWSPGYISVERPPAALGARAVTARPGVYLICATLVAYAALIVAIVRASWSVA
jgi:membrane protease YdiL (CAAX protease family)